MRVLDGGFEAGMGWYRGGIEEGTVPRACLYMQGKEWTNDHVEVLIMACTGAGQVLMSSLQLLHRLLPDQPHLINEIHL